VLIVSTVRNATSFHCLFYIMPTFRKRSSTCADGDEDGDEAGADETAGGGADTRRLLTLGRRLLLVQ
jgi:hypothetical protein